MIYLDEFWSYGRGHVSGSAQVVDVAVQGDAWGRRGWRIYLLLTGGEIIVLNYDNIY